MRWPKRYTQFRARPRTDIGSVYEENRVNRIVQGENLIVLRELAAESVDLIYVDPPFNTGRRQVRPRLTTIRDDSGDRTGFGGARYRTETATDSLSGYADRFENYIGFLRPRMEEARRILTATGSLFLHVDPREVHYCKVPEVDFPPIPQEPRFSTSCRRVCSTLAGNANGTDHIRGKPRGSREAGLCVRTTDIHRPSIQHREKSNPHPAKNGSR